MPKLAICDFKIRIVEDEGGRETRRLNRDQIMEIAWLSSSRIMGDSVCKRQKLIFNTLIYSKPVFENRGGVRELGGLNNSTRRRVLDLLKSV